MNKRGRLIDDNLPEMILDPEEESVGFKL